MNTRVVTINMEATLKKKLANYGINIKGLQYKETLGYGADVNILTGKKNGVVIKIYKDFQPYPSIPFYNRERVSLDIEICNFLKSIKKDCVPKIYGWNVERGEIIMELITSPYELLEKKLVLQENISQKFFKDFAKFLWKKTNKKGQLEKEFYTYSEVKNLRSLFVEQKHEKQINYIFNQGLKFKQAINIGGLSPKNIFIADAKFKLIDFEEAFIGDYLFDLGFFFGHMLLYYIVTKNVSIKTGLIIFLKELDKLMTLSLSEKKQIMSYAGLMLLHRAKGFNLEGDIVNYKTAILKHGESMLYGKPTFDFISLFWYDDFI